MADWLALSVRPPWSWAIVHASKDVENRSGGAGRWRRALDARLMIHASSRWSRSGAADPRVCAAWWDVTDGGEWDRRFGEVPKPQHIAGDLLRLGADKLTLCTRTSRNSPDGCPAHGLTWGAGR